MNNPFQLLLSVFLLLALASCREDIEPIIKPSEFDKPLRERLGEELKLAIAANRQVFPLLPDMPPYQSTIYAYVRDLYQQATREMQLDRRSPDINRWNQARTWQVRIIESDIRNAFVIPGGDFYITTGFLKSLQQEYQLYYIMVFEAVMMQDRHLLDRMIEEYGTQDLYQIARGKASAKGLDSKLANLEMDPVLVELLDEKTANIICKTSSFDRRGILPLIEAVDDPCRWLELRPSYTNRSVKISTDMAGDEDCGDFRTNGGYEEQVLKWF